VVLAQRATCPTREFGGSLRWVAGSRVALARRPEPKAACRPWNCPVRGWRPP